MFKPPILFNTMTPQETKGSTAYPSFQQNTPPITGRSSMKLIKNKNKSDIKLATIESIRFHTEDLEDSY